MGCLAAPAAAVVATVPAVAAPAAATVPAPVAVPATATIGASRHHNDRPRGVVARSVVAGSIGRVGGSHASSGIHAGCAAAEAKAKPKNQKERKKQVDA